MNTAQSLLKGCRNCEGVTMRHNGQHQQWEPAAADGGIATDLSGWLPSAACCGLGGSKWAVTRAKYHIRQMLAEGVNPCDLTTWQLLRRRGIGRETGYIIRKLFPETECKCPMCGNAVKVDPPNAAGERQPAENQKP